MSQKIVWFEGVGELILSKRKGTKNIRLSVGPTGKVRVGLPYWLPYSAGIEFAKQRTDWIKKHQTKTKQPMLIDGLRIGKSYRFKFEFESGRAKTTTSLRGNSVRIVTGLNINSATVQRKAIMAAEKALKLEAEMLLTLRLNLLAKKLELNYKELRIKKMTSRWGSCSSDKVITLNYYLMQLPWQMIDHVLIHELIHTKHLNHGKAFWQTFEDISPQAKQTRKSLRQHHPVLRPPTTSVA